MHVGGAGLRVKAESTQRMFASRFTLRPAREIVEAVPTGYGCAALSAGKWSFAEWIDAWLVRLRDNDNERLKPSGLVIANYNVNAATVEHIRRWADTFGRGSVRVLLDRHMMSNAARGANLATLQRLADAIGADAIRLCNQHSKVCAIVGTDAVLMSSENLSSAPRLANFVCVRDAGFSQSVQALAADVFADLPAWPAAGSASAGAAVLQASVRKLEFPAVALVPAVAGPGAPALGPPAAAKGSTSAPALNGSPASGAAILRPGAAVGNVEALGGATGDIRQHLRRVEALSRSAALTAGDLRALAQARTESLRALADLGGVEVGAMRGLVERLDASLPRRDPTRKALREAVGASLGALQGRDDAVPVPAGASLAGLFDGLRIQTTEGRRAAAAARVQELERDKKEGKLIARDEVERAWESWNVMVRQAMEGLPERMRLDLGRDSYGAADWLEKSIHDVLLTLSEETPGVPPEEQSDTG